MFLDFSGKKENKKKKKKKKKILSDIQILLTW